MYTISYNEAVPEVQNYVAHGTKTNFKNGQGDLITAYLFTRKEIYDLIQSNSSSTLFIIMDLTLDNQANAHYLNPILSEVNNGRINTTNMIQTKVTPYTGSITFNTNPTTNPDGQPVTAADLQEMQVDYVEGKEKTPLRRGGLKIKGYNIDANALANLGLNVPPTSGNENDVFAFVPIIRPVDSKNPNACLSFALAQFNTGVLTGDVEDFAKPCPDKCNNYHQVF